MRQIRYEIMQRTGKFKGINYWKKHAIGSVRAKKEAQIFEGI